MNGNERREDMINCIKTSEEPVSGSFLAKKYGVSRQVVVQDIALLRARGYDIISTNKGYVVNKSGDLSQNLELDVLVPPEEAGNSVYEGLHAGDEVSLDYVVRTDYLKPQGNKDPIQLTCLHIRGIRTLISEGGR